MQFLIFLKRVLSKLPFKSTVVGAFFFLMGCVGEAKVYGADLVLWGLSTVASAAFNCFPEEVQEGGKKVYQFIKGHDKKFWSQFHEFAANSDIVNLDKLVEKGIVTCQAEIYDLYPLNDVKREKGFCIPDCLECLKQEKEILEKYALARLRLEYVDACKKELEEVTKELNLKKKLIDQKSTEKHFVDMGSQYVRNRPEEIERMVEYLEECRSNLWANLFSKYKYVREGGLKNRYARHATVVENRLSYWGDSSIPRIKNADMSSDIKKILDTENFISYTVKDVIYRYNETIKFISIKYEEIFGDEKDSFFFYKEQYEKFFHLSPTHIPLTNDFIDKYEKYIMEYSENKDKSAPMSINNKRNSYERSYSDSTKTHSYTPVTSLGTYMDKKKGEVKKEKEVKNKKGKQSSDSSFSSISALSSSDKDNSSFEIESSQEIKKSSKTSALKKEAIKPKESVVSKTKITGNPNHSKESSGVSSEQSFTEETVSDYVTISDEDPQSIQSKSPGSGDFEYESE